MTLYDEDGDEVIDLPQHRLYRSTGPNKEIIASFAHEREALLCMAAIGRILGTNVYLVAETDPTRTLSLPGFCSAEMSGVVFRPPLFR